MKFQYMNGLSHTHTNDLLNALLECIKFYMYAKQKHLGCKKRRGQSEAAVI